MRKASGAQAQRTRSSFEDPSQIPGGLGIATSKLDSGTDYYRTLFERDGLKVAGLSPLRVAPLPG